MRSYEKTDQMCVRHTGAHLMRWSQIRRKSRSIQEGRKWKNKIDTCLTISVSNNLLNLYSASTRSQKVAIDGIELNRTIQNVLEQSQRKGLTPQQIRLLIIEYIHYKKEPRTENDIRRNIFKGHCINGQDFSGHIIELLINRVCERIQIGGSNYIGPTPLGEKLAKLPFGPNFKSFLEVLDLPTSYDWGTSIDLTIV